MKLDPKLKKKLSTAKKLWMKAKTRASEDVPFGEYEDGRYIGRLVGAEIGESQSSGRLQVTWTWKFLEGEYKGQTVRDFDGLETEDNMMWFGRKIVRLGAEMPDDLDDLPEVLTDLEKSKPVARFKLATKGDYQNVYLQQVLDEDDLEDTEEDEDDENTEEESDDDSDEDESEEEEEEEEEDDSDSDSEDEEEEEEEEETPEEDVELESGMRVTATIKRKEQVGNVISVSEDGKSALIRLDAGGAKVRVPIDHLAVPDEEDDEPKSKKTSKVTKQIGKKSKKAS